MIPTLLHTLTNFTSSFIPKIDERIKGRTHALAVAGLAALASYNPWAAVQLGTTYAIGALVWNRMSQQVRAIPDAPDFQRPVVLVHASANLPAPVVGEPIPDDVLAASIASAEEDRFFREFDQKNASGTNQRAYSFEHEDPILQDGSHIAREHQVLIGGTIMDIQTLMTSMLSKNKICNPLHNGALTTQDLGNLSLQLGISTNDIRSIWTSRIDEIQDFSRAIQAENEIVIRYRASQMLANEPGLDEPHVLQEISAEVAQSGEERLSEKAERVRIQNFLELLRQKNPSMLNAFTDLSIKAIEE